MEKPGGYREMLRVAWPLVVSQGTFTLMLFCDRIFLARHSMTEIEAALPAGVLAFTFISFFMALAGYSGTFVAQYHGAGEPENCGRATAQGIFLALLSWPILLALIPFGNWILHQSGARVAPDVLKAELDYFLILMAGGAAVPFNAAAAGFFTGRGETRINMLAQVAANALNLALAYALIFGRWGFPEMGIRGAGWATVIAGFAAPAMLLGLYFSRRVNAQFHTRRGFRWQWPLMLRICRFGAPSGLHVVVDIGSFTCFVLLTGHFGGQALAASNIALSINNLAFMPLLGIGYAASVVVGQYQGRRDGATAERAGWTALKLGWMYMAFIGATFLLFPGPYFRLFSGPGAHAVPLEQVLPLGRWLLVMMAAWGMLDSLNVIAAGALKGAGDTRFVMIYTFVMSWIVWIAGEFAIVRLGGGIVSAWIWLTVYVILLAGGFLWRFVKGRWKRIEVIERRPADGNGVVE